MTRRPPWSALFPYTTLFRSLADIVVDAAAFLDCLDNAGEIVVGQHHVGRFLGDVRAGDRKSTRLNSSHLVISYAVFCLKKKMNLVPTAQRPIDRRDGRPLHN